MDGPLDFWTPPAGAAPPGLRIYVAFHPALPGWATLCRASGAGLSMAPGSGMGKTQKQEPLHQRSRGEKQIQSTRKKSGEPLRLALNFKAICQPEPEDS